MTEDQKNNLGYRRPPESVAAYGIAHVWPVHLFLAFILSLRKNSTALSELKTGTHEDKYC